MTNGQLNAVTVAPTAQMTVMNHVVPVAASTDGIPQDAGAFAGLLSEIQSQTTEVKVSPDSGQTEQPQIRNSNEPFGRDTVVEGQAVELLAMIHDVPQIVPVSEPAVQRSEEPEKAEVLINPVPLGSAALPAAAQMVLAAYSQPGRMPEVNVPTQQSVDRLQNVAAVPEQPPVVAALPAENRVEQVTASTKSAETVSITSSDDEPAASYSTQAVQSGRMPDVEIPVPLPVDRLQSGVPETERPPALVKTASPSSQPVQSDRMSAVSTLTTLPGDNQHIGASEIIKPALLTSAPDRTQDAQSVADAAQVTAVQTAIMFSEKKTSVAVAESDLPPQGTTAVDAHATLTGKTSQVSSGLQSEMTPVDQAVSAPVSTPETDVEIQLSQPRPITVRATAVHVSTDNRFAASAQETRAARQISDPEQQQGVVKEMASSQQAGAASEEIAVSSGPSRSDDGNQGKPDGASDNVMSVQDMRGQLKPEHQKVASVSAKQVSAEPLRESISEQVVQQVKERLGQHEVKPGNQQITLTLSPDSLGELKMNLNLQGQKLSVEIVTENKVVRDSIVQHADALKDSLGRQNITMESFDVTTGGKGSGNQGQNQNAWRELAKQQQQQFWTSTRGYAAAQADLPSGNVAYMKQAGNSMLDIHY
ncbi:MAG: hypothetical protein A2076_15885 [Geobacteraceae bacterium GWC2_53_11]|nr:MAG: hypothetical protein A2076_15885 [Geobacteraceae bacterium GWC2_53_11]